MAVNRGGEEHTFTEVEEFGGGIVPVLNALSGNPEVAPECLALEAADFIQPGNFDADDEVEGARHRALPMLHPPMDAGDGDRQLAAGQPARCHSRLASIHQMRGVHR